MKKRLSATIEAENRLFFQMIFFAEHNHLYLVMACLLQVLSDGYPPFGSAVRLPLAFLRPLSCF